MKIQSCQIYTQQFLVYLFKFPLILILNFLQEIYLKYELINNLFQLQVNQSIIQGDYFIRDQLIRNDQENLI
ncbi:hypothetical protein pb186bvf_020310 [Paramecium bursaria]